MLIHGRVPTPTQKLERRRATRGKTRVIIANTEELSVSSVSPRGAPRGAESSKQHTSFSEFYAAISLN